MFPDFFVFMDDSEEYFGPLIGRSIVVATGHVVVNLWGNLKDDVSLSSRHVRHVTAQSANVSTSQFVHLLLTHLKRVSKHFLQKLDHLFSNFDPSITLFSRCSTAT